MSYRYGWHNKRMAMDENVRFQVYQATLIVSVDTGFGGPANVHNKFVIIVEDMIILSAYRVGWCNDWMDRRYCGSSV